MGKSRWVVSILLAILLLGSLHGRAQQMYLLTVEDFSGVMESGNESALWVYSADGLALRTATAKGESVTATFRAEPGTYHLWVYHSAGMGWGDGSRRTRIEVRIGEQEGSFGAEPQTNQWIYVGSFQLEKENVVELAGYNEQNSAFVYGLLFVTDQGYTPQEQGPESVRFLKELLAEGDLGTVGALPDAEGLVIGAFTSRAQARYFGFEPVEEPVRDNRYSGKWQHTVGRILVAAGFPGPIPTDWTSYQYLEFDCYAPVQTNAWWKLNIMSENPDTDGGDYYTAEFRVDWVGWKHFKLRLADLSKSRTPVGWHKIDGLEFWNHGWGHEQDPNTVIYFANIRLTR